MTWFVKLYDILAPKTKVRKHMEEAIGYLESHICNSYTSSQPEAARG